MTGSSILLFLWIHACLDLVLRLFSSWGLPLPLSGHACDFQNQSGAEPRQEESCLSTIKEGVISLAQSGLPLPGGEKKEGPSYL